MGSSEMDKSVWVFAVNHGIDDQYSLHLIINELLSSINHPENDGWNESLNFPLSIEEGISLSSLTPQTKTFEWIAHQVFNSVRSPIMVPNAIRRLDKNEAFARYNIEKRRTIIRLFSIPKTVMNSLQEYLRKLSEDSRQKPTITHLLSAVMIYCTNIAIKHFGEVRRDENDYGDGNSLLRFLLSVGLRPYSKLQKNTKGPISDFTWGGVACASGAVDFIVPADDTITNTLQKLLSLTEGSKIDDLIEILRNPIRQTIEYCAQKSRDIIQESQWVPESVRLFDIGMKSVDILQAVEIDANNEKSFGRGYSCGVSNMGKVNFIQKETAESATKQLSVEECFYGTSHHRNGVLCQLSCMTLDKAFYGCLQFPSPLVTAEEAELFQNMVERFIKLLPYF